MSLTNRLTVFFLAALALVLAGFSGTLYALAQSYLTEQTDEKLAAALDTLAAAADRNEQGIEWETHERYLTLGQEHGRDQVRWNVHGDAGLLLDRSANLTGGALKPVGEGMIIGTSGGQIVEREGQRWRLRSRYLTILGRSSKWRFLPPGEGGPAKEVRHVSLTLTVGLSLEPQEAALRNLALALSGLSAGVLLAAGLLGRWYCRRALAPVAAMATAARDLKAADFDGRLPTPGTRDELADLAGAFNGLLGRLREAFERQRRFTGDASHQLRTPLAAVLGQVEVALRRERPAAEYREVLTKVQGQATRLRSIVDMLLFLARADAEARLPQLEEVDLADWLAGHLQHWREHPRWPDLRVEAVPARVRVQPALLGQLVDNLLDNACKYSEPGTPVAVRVGCNDGSVTAVVEDAGCGVAPEDIPHLFEPFFRSADARRRGTAGVGLGLAVARRIASAFGGTLTLDETYAPGARFVLRLPAADRSGRAGVS